MGMLQLVVGWVAKAVGFPAVFEAVDEISPIEQGVRFERDELVRLMRRLKGFDTVEFTDAHGAQIDPEVVAGRRGPDGGVDAVIRIVAGTEAGARNVAGRIRNILLRGDY